MAIKIKFNSYIFWQVAFGFLLLGVPYYSIAFQPVVANDSLKLEESLKVLKRINPKDVDSIIRFTDKLTEIYHRPDQRALLMKVSKSTGFLLSRYGYFQLAEKYYADAVSISQKLNDKRTEVDITNSLGVLWAKRGDYVKAESSFLQSLLTAEKERYIQGIISCFLKLSTLRIRQNRPDECLDYCLKADSVNAENKSHFYEEDLIGNKGIVYAIRGELDKALALFNHSYAMAVKYNRSLEKVLALQNIGLVYKEKQNYATAYKYLNQGLALAKRSGLREQELRLAINIPITLIAEKKYQPAETKLLALVKKSKEQGLQDLTLEIYQNLTDLAKLQGDYKKAFEYFQAFTDLKDQQINEQKERALQEANVSLGLYKTNQRLVENQDLLFETSRERNIILGILVFVAVLLGFLVFILMRLRRLNLRLNVKREQLLESNNVKNKLFSIIGHDLRSHQSTTLGILSLIKDGELDEEELKTYLNMIIKQSESALATLEDLLLWGQAQIKGNKLDMSAHAVLPIVERAIDLNAEAIREKKLRFKTVNLQNNEIFGYGNHFSFVIRNLIANAIKFTPGEGNITVYLEEYTTDLVKICVADDGIGVDGDKLDAIFSPENVSKGGTNNEVGTGLGLILCKEFIEANGGKIWAEINSDGGTTICFTCRRFDSP